MDTLTCDALFFLNIYIQSYMAYFFDKKNILRIPSLKKEKRQINIFSQHSHTAKWNVQRVRGELITQELVLLLPPVPLIVTWLWT